MSPSRALFFWRLVTLLWAINISTLSTTGFSGDHSRPFLGTVLGGLLAIGLGILVLADLALAFLPSIGGVLFGVALWGAHMGVTQGLLSALVADAAPDRLRGTAFGVFNLATGLTLLLASVLAGALWSQFGAPATFLAGAAFCALALLGGTVLSRGSGERGSG